MIFTEPVEAGAGNSAAANVANYTLNLGASVTGAVNGRNVVWTIDPGSSDQDMGIFAIVAHVHEVAEHRDGFRIVELARFCANRAASPLS